MIDVAVLASTPYLRRLSAAGTIDMALTHLVLAQPGYAGFFQAHTRAGVTVMLDNSAYELQETTGAGLAAGPATLLTTQRFLDAARHHDSAGAAGLRFIGVPQGRTRAEWLDCYQRLVAMPGIDMIGLSKLSVPRCFGAPVAEARIACVAHLLELGAPKPFHLLGGDRSLPWELREHRRRGHDRAEHGGVRSNDSSFAFWYAASSIGVDDRTGRAERDATTRPDLVAGELAETDLATAIKHVALLRRAAGLSAFGPGTHSAPVAPAPTDQEGSPCH